MSPIYIDPRDSNWLGHRTFDTLRPQTDKIWTYFHSFKGGWEAWTQFELAVALTRATEATVDVARDAQLYETVTSDVTREDAYPKQRPIRPDPFNKVYGQAAKDRTKSIKELNHWLNLSPSEQVAAKAKSERTQQQFKTIDNDDNSSMKYVPTLEKGSKDKKRKISKGTEQQSGVTEQQSGANEQRSDFTITASYDDLHELHTVELKCRTNRESNSEFVGRVRKDIEKVQKTVWHYTTEENAEEKMNISVWILAISIDGTENGDVNERMFALGKECGIALEVIDLTVDGKMKIWTYEFPIKIIFLHSLFSYSRPTQMLHESDPKHCRQMNEDGYILEDEDMM